MFEIGDYVVSVNNGICKIEDIVRLRLSSVDRRQRYYLLVPLTEQTAKLYIPQDGTSHGLRLVMNEEEARDFLDRIPLIEEIAVEDEKLREKIYKEAIQSTEPEALVSMIKSMLRRRMQRQAQGKKGTAVDERYYQIALGNLSEELSFVLGLQPDEVQEIISESDNLLLV